MEMRSSQLDGVAILVVVIDASSCLDRLLMKVFMSRASSLLETSLAAALVASALAIAASAASLALCATLASDSLVASEEPDGSPDVHE